MADFKCSWAILFKKVKVAAALTIAKGLRARKPYFLKVAVSDVIHIAKKAAELGAAVFNAGGVPKAGRDGDIVKAFALLLGADLQIGSAHNMQKNMAVQ